MGRDVSERIHRELGKGSKAEVRRRLTDEVPDRVDHRIQRYLMFQLPYSLALFMVTFFLFMIASILSRNPVALAIYIPIVVALLVMIIRVAPRRFYENFSFHLTDDAVIITSGILTVTTTKRLYSRIDTVSIVQGYFDRKYGLCSVQLPPWTNIPGLTPEEAAVVSDVMLERRRTFTTKDEKVELRTADDVKRQMLEELREIRRLLERGGK